MGRPSLRETVASAEPACDTGVLGAHGPGAHLDQGTVSPRMIRAVGFRDGGERGEVLTAERGWGCVESVKNGFEGRGRETLGDSG